MKTFHNLLFFCASVIAAGFMSCSKDDSNGSGLAQTSVVKDSVRVDFSLTNSRGDTTATFSYGEDIVFDLKVQAQTSDWLSYGNDYVLFESGEDYLFRVRSEEGEDFGSPVSMSEIGELVGIYMARNLPPRHFRSSWLGAFKPSYPLKYSSRQKSPLPRGRYFVEAPVHVFVDHRLIGGVPDSGLWLDANRVETNDSIYITCQLHFSVE